MIPVTVEDLLGCCCLACLTHFMLLHDILHVCFFFAYCLHIWQCYGMQFSVSHWCEWIIMIKDTFECAPKKCKQARFQGRTCPMFQPWSGPPFSLLFSPPVLLSSCFHSNASLYSPSCSDLLCWHFVWTCCVLSVMILARATGLCNRLERAASNNMEKKTCAQ